MTSVRDECSERRAIEWGIQPIIVFVSLLLYFCPFIAGGLSPLELCCE
jgi:hypothetical protein